MEDRLKGWLKQLKLNESTISMILGGLVVAVVGILIYNYFTTVDRSLPEIAEVEEATEAGLLAGLPTTHAVAAGEDLSIIAEKYYGDREKWTAIVDANTLVNPDQLVAGQELTIPQVEVQKVDEVSGVAEGEEVPQADETEEVVAEEPEPEKEEVGDVAGSSVIEGDSYEVKAGEGLWDIAVRAYQDGYRWSEILEANRDKIRNPDRLEAGMVLVIPR